jgi:hypothetical protein
LCELDKFERVRLGEGKPKRRFVPDPEPLPWGATDARGGRMPGAAGSAFPPVMPLAAPGESARARLGALRAPRRVAKASTSSVRNGSGN